MAKSRAEGDGRLNLARDGVTVSRARILEMNHPDFDEPTLGTVVDGIFYFSIPLSSVPKTPC